MNRRKSYKKHENVYMLYKSWEIEKRNILMFVETLETFRCIKYGRTQNTSTCVDTNVMPQLPSTKENTP